MIFNRRLWWHRNRRLVAAVFRRRRWWNALKAAIGYRWSFVRFSSMVSHYPTALTFEPTTHCNLRCPQCISGLRAFTRPTGQADAALFRKVIDELHPYVFYVSLYFQGEPLLNPNFFQMVAYAHQKGIFTDTSTNGHYFSDDNCRQLIDSGLSQVIISLDGADAETYRKYRIGGQWEKVLAGVQNLIRWRRQMKAAHPYVVLQFILFSHNEGQVADVEALARSLGVDELRLKTAQVYEEWDGAAWVPKDAALSRYEREGEHLRLRRTGRRGCSRLWMEPTITWDGQVLPCCFDKDADHPMGSLTDAAFSEIWNGPAYQTFRRNLWKSRDQYAMCSNCSEGVRLWVEP